jgi:antirestriction protein ArdC
MTQTQTTQTAPDFRQLLESAVTDPGVVSRAYFAFHNYSFGNQLLAYAQCKERGIQPAPLATFPAWKAKGRFVRKGEKAIVLCMPITLKRKTTDESGEESEDAACFTRFVYKPHWFVLSQTDGADVEPEPLPEWDRARALSALDITEVPFEHMDGNCQGLAGARSIAVSPVAELPEKTRFHELAHVVLGHTSETELTDSEKTPRTIREVEAESVALLCLAALNLPGADHCRGYIQAWNTTGEPISERSAQRILKAADQILRAGREAAKE